MGVKEFKHIKILLIYFYYDLNYQRITVFSYIKQSKNAKKKMPGISA